MTASFSANTVPIDGMASIKATQISPPPGWALLERQLISLMEKAVDLAAKKYSRPDGTPYNVNDVDDTYEAHSYKGLLYAIGADDSVLEIGLREWNAITRFYDDGVVRWGDEPVHPAFRVQLHNEYYNLNGPADWFHMGEGNQSFYSFGLADPTNPENVRRAKRFAAMYMNEDPEAANYDPEYRIIRSPFHGSVGPRFHADLAMAKILLDPIYYPGGVARGHAQRSNLYPVVVDLEEDWFENPERAEEILKIFDEVVLNGDIPDNLAATALITNAYLYTGEEKYKQWVLEYTEAWMERTQGNNGIIPDNVGPTGKVGEQRGGQWWGGFYGWNSRNSARNAFLAATIAAECALLLTGDFGYLDLIRSQIEFLLSLSKTRDDGQLLVPTRITPNGWEGYQPRGIQWLARVYHASIDSKDYELITRLREGERETDWNAIEVAGDRSSGNLEARFQYYDGQNPDWPEKRLQAEYQYVLAMFEFMRRDPRDVAQIVADNKWPPNPVVTKGLTQVTMGSPQPVYNGGLLRATVRHFDPDRARPGLPKDVAALVDKLESDRVGIELVNLSRTEIRNVIVQAGAFGEHQFTEVRFQETSQEGLAQNPYAWLRGENSQTKKVVSIDAKYFAVQLPPSTHIRLEVGMRRFVNQPSYAFPWYGGKIPAPFQ